MAFVNPAADVIVGAVDSHHLLGLYRVPSRRNRPAQEQKIQPLAEILDRAAAWWRSCSGASGGSVI